MKTLADFKRKLTLGSKWECMHELHNCNYGEREVVFKNTVKVGFRITKGLLKDSDSISYFYFPTADLIEFHNQEVHVFHPKNDMYEKPRRHVLTYKLIEA